MVSVHNTINYHTMSGQSLKLTDYFIGVYGALSVSDVGFPDWNTIYEAGHTWPVGTLPRRINSSIFIIYDENLKIFNNTTAPGWVNRQYVSVNDMWKNSVDFTKVKIFRGLPDNNYVYNITLNGVL